jgi:hypothetical protein
MRSTTNEPGQFLHHLLTNAAEPDDQDGHLRNLAHLPATCPAPVALLGEQPPQILCTGQHAENGEFGQRSAMDPGRGREDDPAQLVLAQSGALHLAAAAWPPSCEPSGVKVRC